MAGSTITYPLNGAANWESFPDIVQKIQAGFRRVSLTNFDNASEPQVEAGSTLDVNGTPVVFGSNESISGWSGISAGNDVYIKIVVSGSSATVVFTTTAPTYSASKRGYYNGNDRYIGGLWKASSTKYCNKWLYPGNGEARIKNGAVKPHAVTFDGTPVEDATYGPAITLTDAVSKGQPILFLHNRYGSGSNYVWKKASTVLTPTGSMGYNPMMVYLGDDLWAHCYLRAGTPYNLYLRVYEHNWGSTTLTQRGSTTIVWSGSSDFHNLMGIVYLGDVSGKAQLMILVHPSSSYGLKFYTYEIDKTSYTISQLGSAETKESGVTTGVLYSSCKGFRDQWQRFYLFFNDSQGSGTLYFKVYDHDGDGTYTEVDSLTVNTSSNSHRFYGGTHAIKMSANVYRWIVACNSAYQVDPAPSIMCIEFDDSTDTLSPVWKSWRNIETYTEYKGFHVQEEEVVSAAPTEYNTITQIVGITGPESWISLFQVAAGSGFARILIKHSGIDLADEKTIDDESVRICNSYYQLSTPDGLITMQKNGVHFFGIALQHNDGSSTYPEEYVGLVFYDGVTRLKGMALMAVEDPLGSANKQISHFDMTFDGRFSYSWQYSNAGNERSILIYVPICVGVADDNYVAGDVVRPLIRGKLRGMSSVISYTQLGLRLGWSISAGTIQSYGPNMVPVGRVISEDVVEIDVPMNGYPYESIDQRLS